MPTSRASKWEGPAQCMPALEAAAAAADMWPFACCMPPPTVPSMCASAACADGCPVQREQAELQRRQAAGRGTHACIQADLIMTCPARPPAPPSRIMRAPCIPPLAHTLLQWPSTASRTGRQPWWTAPSTSSSACIATLCSGRRACISSDPSTAPLASLSSQTPSRARRWSARCSVSAVEGPLSLCPS